MNEQCFLNEKQIIQKKQEIKIANDKIANKIHILEKRNILEKAKIENQLKKINDDYLLKKQKLLLKFNKSKNISKYQINEDKINKKYENLIKSAKKNNNMKLVAVLNNKFQIKKSNLIQNRNEFLSIINKLFNCKIEKLDENYDLALKNIEWAKKDLEIGKNKSIEQYKKTYLIKVLKRWDRIEYKLIYNKEKELLRNNLERINSEDKIEYDNLKYQIKNLNKSIFNKKIWNYQPPIILLENLLIKIKSILKLNFNKYKEKLILLRNYNLKDWLNIKIWTIPLYLYAMMVLVISLGIYFKALQVNMISAMAILFVVAILGGTIFNHIPIWNKYMGGGVIGSMFVGTILVTLNIIPKTSETYKIIDTWFSKQNFLSLYISVLLVGAVLTIPRKMILKSLTGFFGLIIAGCVVSTFLAILVGMALQKTPQDIILNYLLPTLADGNGGGIQPIDKIAQDNGYFEIVNGEKKSIWISSALAISTLSSIFSVIGASILNALGKAKPNLSGEGRLLQKEIHIIEKQVEVKDRNVAVGLVLVVVLYVFSDIIAKKILSEKVIGIHIPNFAWMIVLCLFLNLTNLVPAEIKAGTEKLNKFVAKQLTWVLMVGVGIINIDLDKFISALNPSSILICMIMVFGVILGPILLAKLIKFYAVESAITAGLCMSAQGGSGAIACLGASNRMNLMPYAQITCRIAGSVVLIFASLAFSIWPHIN